MATPVKDAIQLGLKSKIAKGKIRAPKAAIGNIFSLWDIAFGIFFIIGEK